MANEVDCKKHCGLGVVMVWIPIASDPSTVMLSPGGLEWILQLPVPP